MLPKIKIYSCGVCDDYFTKNSSHYKRHVRRCRNKRDPSLNLCDLCDFEASSTCELKEHKSKVHWPSGVLQCEHCEYQTRYRKDLNRHLETHQEKRYRYQCPHCDSLYLRLQHLRRHIRDSHCNNEKRQNEIWHHCSQPGCDYKTAQASHVIRHMNLVHSTRRAYQCEHCEKTYKLKSHLRRHFKDSHFGQVYGDSGCDSQVRRFQCDFCEYKAKSEPVLKFHLMIHTGEKPYTCNICNRSFRQPNTLKMHINTHTGERPYKCRECGAAFSQHGSLYTHKKLIHHTK